MHRFRRHLCLPRFLYYDNEVFQISVVPIAQAISLTRCKKRPGSDGWRGSVTGGTMVCDGSNSTPVVLSGHTGTVEHWHILVEFFQRGPKSPDAVHVKADQPFMLIHTKLAENSRISNFKFQISDFGFQIWNFKFEI